MSVPSQYADALKAARERGLLDDRQTAALDVMEQRGIVDRGPSMIFEPVKNNGFWMGFMDQVKGMSQLAAHISPDSRTPEMVIQNMPSTARVIDEKIKREELEYQKQRALSGDEGFDWDRMAGAIVNPISMSTLAPVKAATTIGGRIATGGAYGAATGASMPVTGENADFALSKAAQTGIGATIGMAFPGVVEVVKGAGSVSKYLTRPFTESGRLKDLKDMYFNLAGDARESLVNALNNPKTYLSRPTSGQVIAEQNLTNSQNIGGAIVRLEKDLSRKAATGDPLKTIYTKQVKRRADSIKNMVDSSDSGLDMAKRLRTAITSPLYKQVEESGRRVDIGPTFKQLVTTLEKNANEDSVARPLRDIMTKMYRMTDRGPIFETRPQALYSLSKNIKNMMGTKRADGSDEFNVLVLSDIKKSLDDQIGKGEPLYKQAQNLYREYSKPIDKIKVVRQLGESLKTAIEEESPTPFLNAINNAPRTLKRSTGFSRYKNLNQILDKDQMQIVGKVKEELIRQGKAKRMASETESQYKVLQEGIEPQLPNMLSRPALLANALLRRIGKDKGPEYEKLAVELQKNPKMLADLLKEPATSKKRKMAYELFTLMSATVPIRGLAREAQISTNQQQPQLGDLIGQ